MKLELELEGLKKKRDHFLLLNLHSMVGRLNLDQTFGLSLYLEYLIMIINEKFVKGLLHCHNEYLFFFFFFSLGFTICGAFAQISN